MTHRIWWAWLLGAVLLAGCGGCVGPTPLPPIPTPPPIPVPPDPEPTPIPPTPTPPPEPPTGHIVTVAEYDAVVKDVTTGDQILERFGAPRVQNPIGLPGTTALVYDAIGPNGEARMAEFWIRDGKVINKNFL